MKTVDLTKYLKQQLGLSDLYPNVVLGDKDCTGLFGYSSDQDAYVPVGNTKYQFYTVASSKENAEDISNNIMQKLKELTYPFILDDMFIVGLDILNMTPLYIGKDENNRFIFSFNINLHLQKK